MQFENRAEVAASPDKLYDFLMDIRSVSECVGVRYEHGDAVAIPLPHPSGASSWLNVPDNRDRVAAAAELVRAELSRL